MTKFNLVLAFVLVTAAAFGSETALTKKKHGFQTNMPFIFSDDGKHKATAGPSLIVTGAATGQIYTPGSSLSLNIVPSKNLGQDYYVVVACNSNCYDATTKEIYNFVLGTTQTGTFQLIVKGDTLKGFADFCALAPSNALDTGKAWGGNIFFAVFAQKNVTVGGVTTAETLASGRINGTVQFQPNITVSPYGSTFPTTAVLGASTDLPFNISIDPVVNQETDTPKATYDFGDGVKEDGVAGVNNTGWLVDHQHTWVVGGTFPCSVTVSQFGASTKLSFQIVVAAPDIIETRDIDGKHIVINIDRVTMAIKGITGATGLNPQVKFKKGAKGQLPTYQGVLF